MVILQVYTPLCGTEPYFLSLFLSLLTCIRYGDTGIYRTHLFGYPVIVTCSPELNKQVLGSLTEDGSFSTGWPSSQLIGNSSVAVVDGPLHKGLRRCLMQAVNSPSALDFHLRTAQPLLISALEEWAFKRKVVAFEETKAVSILPVISHKSVKKT